MRGRLQHQMENELKKRNQIEDILKASGAPAEALRILAGKFWAMIIFLNDFLSQIKSLSISYTFIVVPRKSDIKKIHRKSEKIYCETVDYNFENFNNNVDMAFKEAYEFLMLLTSHKMMISSAPQTL